MTRDLTDEARELAANARLTDDDLRRLALDRSLAAAMALDMRAPSPLRRIAEAVRELAAGDDIDCGLVSLPHCTSLHSAIIAAGGRENGHSTTGRAIGLPDGNYYLPSAEIVIGGVRISACGRPRRIAGQPDAEAIAVGAVATW